MSKPALSYSTRRVLGVAVLIVLTSLTLLAEGVEWNPQPRVEVGLEQRASLLEIPPSRLSIAREALVQATRVELSDLLGNDMYDPRALVREWERLHPQAMNSVISFRGGQLSVTRDSATASKELIPLFAEMVETDPARIRELPSARFVNASQRDFLLNQIVQYRLKMRTVEGSADSDEINNMLAKVQRTYPEFRMSFEIRGLLVRRLWIEKRVTEARKVAESMPEAFRRCFPTTTWLSEDFGKGLRWIGRYTPDFFLTGFSLLDEALNQTGKEQAGYNLLAKEGSSSVFVSWADRVRLNTLAGLRPSEPVRERLLAARPELRVLVERVNLRGGQLYYPPLLYGLPRDQESQDAAEQLVSDLLNRSYRAVRGSRGSSSMMHSSINFSGTDSGFGPSLPDRIGQGTPAASWRSTRSRLARELGTLEKFDLLFRYASSIVLADKCRREALKISLKLLDEAREPLLRARLLTGILPLERRFGDAAVAADHLAEARTLLVQLRKSPPSNAGAAGSDGVGMAIDAFERVVVAEWAWVDSRSAMSHAGELTGFNRFAVYLDIARLLSQSPYYRNWPNAF